MLLTFFDMSARGHYLNARRTLRRLLDWRVVPVINENDTTATDEISFGDNDFLAAQVAILIGAEQLVLLTDIDGLYTADPRTDPGAQLVGEVTDFEALRRARRSATTTSPLGSGGMRSKVVAAEMATAAGIPAVICNGLRRARSAAALAGEPVGTRFPARERALLVLQALAALRQAVARDASSSTRARRARCARAARRCCPSGSSRSTARSTRATPSRSPSGGGVAARQGHLQLLARPSCAGSAG